MPAQSHALPFRLNGGTCEVLHVTSRRKGKWILPKGKIEPGGTASQRAAIETFEEPGVRGTVSSQPLATSALMDPSRAKVYPLMVEEELELAGNERARASVAFPVRSAHFLRDKGLQHALKAFAGQRTWAKVQQDRGSLRLRCNAIFRQQTGAANTAGAPHACGMTALYANALKG
jgi:ADP-ribose pyrophosphatase YjhB (NUDIX family)